jgi:hypothetical protein
MSEKTHQRVVKASAPTLVTNTQNSEQDNKLHLPPISLSDDTKKSLEAVARQMKSATESIAPSENPNAPDDKMLDPLFADMMNPPDLAIASISARNAIESDLEKLRIDDLFLSGEIHQYVDVIRGKLRVKFRTLRTQEDLYIKRKLSEVKNENVRYAEDRLTVMYIAAHLVEINGQKLPDLADAMGKISDKNFDARFQQVSNLPQILIERVWVNLRWFEDRVRKALSPDFLGNG